jgi:hypothetical protein
MGAVRTECPLAPIDPRLPSAPEFLLGLEARSTVIGFAKAIWSQRTITLRVRLSRLLSMTTVVLSGNLGNARPPRHSVVGAPPTRDPPRGQVCCLTGIAEQPLLPPRGPRPFLDILSRNWVQE